MCCNAEVHDTAALGWTEALTLIADSLAPDEIYEEARNQFSEEDRVKLSVAIGLIDAWNRIAVGVRYVHPVEGPRRNRGRRQSR